MLAPTATPPAGNNQRGKVICNCLNVAEREIKAAIAAGQALDADAADAEMWHQLRLVRAGSKTDDLPAWSKQEATNNSVGRRQSPHLDEASQSLNLTHYIKEIGRGKDGARDMTEQRACELFGAMLDGGVPIWSWARS